MTDISATNLYKTPLDKSGVEPKQKTSILNIAVFILSIMVLICLAIIIWLAVTLSRDNTSNTYNTYDTPVTYPTQNQLTATTAKAFLITCIDFRLIDDQQNKMNQLGYNNNYDYFILAGGSLGLLNTTWNQTAIQHLGIAISLHQIQQVIIIDHQDCGYYKIYKPEIKNMTYIQKVQLHTSVMVDAFKMINASHPKLKHTGYLMSLTGEASKIYQDDNL